MMYGCAPGVERVKKPMLSMDISMDGSEVLMDGRLGKIVGERSWKAESIS